MADLKDSYYIQVDTAVVCHNEVGEWERMVHTVPVEELVHWLENKRAPVLPRGANLVLLAVPAATGTVPWAGSLAVPTVDKLAAH